MIDSTKARLAVGIVGTAPAGIAMASALAGAGHLLIGIILRRQRTNWCRF